MRGLRIAVVAALTVTLIACAGLPGRDGDGFGRGAGPQTSGDAQIARFRAVLAQRPNDFGALMGIGDVYFARAAWSRASGAYREALVVAPGNRAALTRYSTALSAERAYAPALNYGQRALAARGGPAAVIATAVALNGTRRHAQARALIEAAIARNPRDLDLRSNLALTMALQGDGGAFAVQRSVAYAPDADFRHRRNLVLVAAMLGMEERARGDAGALGLSAQVTQAVIEIGRRARSKGVDAFGIALPV